MRYRFINDVHIEIIPRYAMADPMESQHQMYDQHSCHKSDGFASIEVPPRNQTNDVAIFEHSVSLYHSAYRSLEVGDQLLRYSILQADSGFLANWPSTGNVLRCVKNSCVYQEHPTICLAHFSGMR
jgi:hypothetical protein